VGGKEGFSSIGVVESGKLRAIEKLGGGNKLSENLEIIGEETYEKGYQALASSECSRKTKRRGPWRFSSTPRDLIAIRIIAKAL